MQHVMVVGAQFHPKKYRMKLPEISQTIQPSETTAISEGYRLQLRLKINFENISTLVCSETCGE